MYRKWLCATVSCSIHHQKWGNEIHILLGSGSSQSVDGCQCLLQQVQEGNQKGQRGCYVILLQRLRHLAPKATLSCSILAHFQAFLTERTGLRSEIVRQATKSRGVFPPKKGRVSHLIPNFLYVKKRREKVIL